MLDGINDFAEYDSEKRWFTRRCVFILMLLVVSYVGSWIPVEHVLKTRNGLATKQVRQIMFAIYQPLDFLLRRPPTRGSSFTDDIVVALESLCVRIDKSVTRWAIDGYPISAWGVVTALLGFVSAYGLSPLPLVWCIKFLGIDKLELTRDLFELYCAPIEWMSEYSSTIRSFYEEYGVFFELTD